MKIMKNLEELKAQKLKVEEELENIEKEIKNQIELQTFSKFEEDKYYRISFGTTIWYFKFKKELCTLDTYSKNIIIRKLIIHTFSLAASKYIISNIERMIKNEKKLFIWCYRILYYFSFNRCDIYCFIGVD